MEYKIFDSELKILEILWESGPLSAKEVAAAAAGQVGWSKTTTYTMLKKCVEKGLVEEAGRLELPGRPIAYKTTANFLRCFGLENIGQLPKLPPAKNTAEETSLEAADLEEPT